MLRLPPNTRLLVPRVPSSNSDVTRTCPSGISTNGICALQFSENENVRLFVHVVPNREITPRRSELAVALDIAAVLRQVERADARAVLVVDVRVAAERDRVRLSLPLHRVPVQPALEAVIPVELRVLRPSDPRGS
jgi:hypothetical protein